MLKVRRNFVFQYNEVQPNSKPLNPNSAMLYNVYYGQFTYSSYVLIRVIMEIIQPQLFAELRTKRNLGYTVIGAFIFYRGVVGAMIKIQSSKFNPEELENEINIFLKTLRAKGKFEDNVVNKVI